ncbi:Crp/Fnr family transcriptional regulator [Mucilaginibacter pedocola]|uniref:Crp/Fnr family transcriptional regulator n=1 Tax=Mucilaginibacter pedocola TaxID=1792845 RepID=A0A1S9P9P1_9SPHI|nr:Crp/Fnr family transcriptional regulator [Mucilaginibacter pedocola]OOQ57706.1 Crp/Fnr family transcriptional regulator [Mucilaginibacter pedocola]
MEPIAQLKKSVMEVSGMREEDFALSLPYWHHKTYKKGEFYNEYRNVCKHLGFILSGVFRIYRFDDRTSTERNMLFFTANQFMSPYKSFLNQQACEYYTEAMSVADIYYIHYDHLQYLYQTSPAWERFGRLYAEAALNTVMTNTEGFLFKTAEERYREMLDIHPDIFDAVPLYHIASYLGIEGPSLSRIRKRLKA